MKFMGNYVFFSGVQSSGDKYYYQIDNKPK